ncbi:MAG TPA: DivIVA domain-containing protein [Solirubrobacteraceae bacterium]|nr:DivIVA domain-containing protein [Solirubrobacteraceae bacterium]
MPDLGDSELPDGAEPDERPAEEQEDDATTQLFRLAKPLELVPAEFRDVSFSPAVGGYNRKQVDAYVERVNRLIAELEISRSPEKAVQLALDRVGEQTAGILQHAREAAEELTAAAVSESEHASRRARVEADEVLEQAQNDARDMLDRAAADSAELVARSQQRLEAIREATEDGRREHAHVLEQLRSTAVALQAFAEQAQDGGRPSEVPPEPAEDADQQATEVIEAVEPVEEDGEDPGDADGDAGELPPRRRITRSRPRPARRETAGSGPARRD